MDFETIMRLMATKKQAIEDEVCNLCSEPILSFRDAISKTEYGISGLCQNCQDEIFTPDPFTESDDV
jgi:hypothetical protein